MGVNPVSRESNVTKFAGKIMFARSAQLNIAYMFMYIQVPIISSHESYNVSTQETFASY